MVLASKILIIENRPVTGLNSVNELMIILFKNGTLQLTQKTDNTYWENIRRLIFLETELNFSNTEKKIHDSRYQFKTLVLESAQYRQNFLFWRYHKQN